MRPSKQNFGSEMLLALASVVIEEEKVRICYLHLKFVLSSLKVYLNTDTVYNSKNNKSGV